MYISSKWSSFKFTSSTDFFPKAPKLLVLLLISIWCTSWRNISRKLQNVSVWCWNFLLVSNVNSETAKFSCRVHFFLSKKIKVVLKWKQQIYDKNVQVTKWYRKRCKILIFVLEKFFTFWVCYFWMPAV